MAAQSTSNSLNRPISIGSVVLRNRLYRAPVLEGAGSDAGAADVYRKSFERNAKAGVGLIIQGNSCVSEQGRSSPGMTIVNTRDRAMALSEVPTAVHLHGARIFMQIGHSGIYSIEGWHTKYARGRAEPLLAVSRPPAYVRPALFGVPWKVLSTSEAYDFAESFGRTAGWIREAGYDGVQVASANAKLVHQFLSPFYNRRRDEFGGSLRSRARILEVIAEAARRHAGEDFPITVKIPIDEDAPPMSPRITFEDGLELCKLAESFGYDAITPVGLSVFPHASLCRGAHPSAILEVTSIRKRFEEALGHSRIKMAVLRWGYWQAARSYPFVSVWNRKYFAAAKRAVSIPVLAVGGIRAFEECEEILKANEADMIGMGRPFYAEPDFPRRLLAGDHREVLCESSNRCVPPQQLGMRARCYNPNVARKKEELAAQSPRGLNASEQLRPE